MFIEHASRKLAGSAVDFYRDIKEEKVKKRIVTIAFGRWLQSGFSEA